MKKIKVLLLEDDSDAIVQFTDALPSDAFEIVGIARTLEEGLALYQSENSIDIAIIDIFLQGQPHGISFAKHVHEAETTIPFIFLTSSMDKHIFQQAKMTFPYNYLIKPFNTPELSFAIELAIEKFGHSEDAFSKKETVFYNDAFFIKHKQGLVKVTIEDIEYITVEGPYCNMITEKGSYVLQISLQKLMNDLPQDQFIQTHRNCTVNIKMIDTIFPSDNLILLKSGAKTLLSRRLKEGVLSRYKIYK